MRGSRAATGQIDGDHGSVRPAPVAVGHGAPGTITLYEDVCDALTVIGGISRALRDRPDMSPERRAAYVQTLARKCEELEGNLLPVLRRLRHFAG